jgi:hypothetical protein
MTRPILISHFLGRAPRDPPKAETRGSGYPGVPCSRSPVAIIGTASRPYYPSRSLTQGSFWWLEGAQLQLRLHLRDALTCILFPRDLTSYP